MGKREGRVGLSAVKVLLFSAMYGRVGGNVLPGW